MTLEPLLGSTALSGRCRLENIIATQCRQHSGVPRNSRHAPPSGPTPGRVLRALGHPTGHLAHKKPPCPLRPPWEPRHGPTVGSSGVAVSHARDTPAGPAFTQPSRTEGLESSRQASPRQFVQVAQASRINPHTIVPCSGSFSSSENAERAFSRRGTAPASRTDHSFLTEKETTGVPRL